MTTAPHNQDSEFQDQPPVDPSLRARALAKYESFLEKFPEKHADLTSEDVRQTIYELRVHQLELQMQNDELRESQLALEESRTRFRDLYDNAPVGYCFVSADGLIDDVNRTLGDMLGYTPSQLNGQKFTSLIDKDDQDVFYHLRRRILASQRSQTCKVRMHKSDASTAWIELSVKVASVEGERICLRVSLMNIDARVHAEATRVLLENQLRESQKMEAMGALAAGIAHDFNNILTVILANAEMTDRLTRADAPAVIPFVNEIQRAAGRARELVNQILAFCRRQPTNRHAVSLADVIDEGIGMLRATMPARFQVEFSHDANVPRVLADDTQIEQVVINLATNAMQAMEGKAGRLLIHLDTIHLNAETVNDLKLNEGLWSSCDSAVRIIFEDNGPGMEPSEVDKIFEPFYTTKPVNQGTGLGLAVVQRIVRAHDGQIVVQTKPGQGTVFTIYLPPAQPSTLESRNVKERDLVGKLQERDQVTLGNAAPVDRCILYVDDDSFVLSAIVQLLKQHGILVRGYSDPTVALEFLHDTAHQVEILVTDYNMPGMSGLEFAQQVHKIRPALPVVMTSGYIDDELRSQAYKAGVVALLPKPISSKNLLDLLKQGRQNA